MGLKVFLEGSFESKLLVTDIATVGLHLSFKVVGKLEMNFEVFEELKFFITHLTGEDVQVYFLLFDGDIDQVMLSSNVRTWNE